MPTLLWDAGVRKWKEQNVRYVAAAITAQDAV